MSTSWNVVLKGTPKQEIRALPDNVRKAAMIRITELRDDPFPPDAIPLQGLPGLWRLRFAAAYRLIYYVSRKQRKVVVFRARHRNNAYEGLQPLRVNPETGELSQ